MPTRHLRRNWLRMAALASAFAAVAAGAQTSAPCPPPPQPAIRDRNPPTYFYRDIESCRVFSLQMHYDPIAGYSTFYWYWREDTPEELQSYVDRGWRIAVTDQLLAGAKMQVVEYLNTGLNHYFLAIPDEFGAIERGEAGPGRVRTGYSFTARTVTMSPFSAYVCRCYGSVWPGPNSHFFTVDPQECRALQNITQRTPADEPRWDYEGHPFNAFPVSVAGTCAANQIPVWRAFNGGPARGIESNHRFSTDQSVIDGMVSQGWTAEGIAFCADASQ